MSSAGTFGIQCLSNQAISVVHGCPIKMTVPCRLFLGTCLMLRVAKINSPLVDTHRGQHSGQIFYSYPTDSMALSPLRHHAPDLSIVSYEIDSPSDRGSQGSIYWVHASLLVLAGLPACGWEPQVLFQPTWVGLMWACLFLAGCLLGSQDRNRWPTMLAALSIAYVAWWGFRSLTDVPAPDSLLLSVILMLSGWGVTTWHRARVRFTEARVGASSVAEGWRWSIGEIGWLTTLGACLAHAIPGLQTPAWLMLSVGTALMSAVLCSWIAYWWAWNDAWDRWKLGVLAVVMCASVWIVQVSAPRGLSVLTSIQWVLSGPLNVVAAQGVSVLLVQALWRWNAGGERLAADA
jgi:hypothetical protein